jgi:hypothetical protein
MWSGIARNLRSLASPLAIRVSFGPYVRMIVVQVATSHTV